MVPVQGVFSGPGLVDNCEFGTGERPTSCMDLQGFWEMIYFQVHSTSYLVFERFKKRYGNSELTVTRKSVLNFCQDEFP